MDDYIIYLIKNNKAEEFTDDLKRKYKRYICNINNDILIYAIKNTTSLEIISTIIKWYDTLNYAAYPEKYRKGIPVPPLLVAISLDKFDIANLLIENKASADYIFDDEFDYCFNYEKLNIETLCYMIDIGINIKDNLLLRKLKELINANDNDVNYLEKYFKCLLIKYYKDLDLNEFPEKELSIQIILYEIIKAENYYLLEKSFEYCDEKEENLLNILFKLFDGFSQHLHQNKKDAFINNIKNKDLKNKIINYFDEKELPDKRRKRIMDIAKGGNLKELQQYLKDNKIELISLNDDHFDILISAIENKVPVKIVKYIISQGYYHNLDYYISLMDDFLKFYFINEINQKDIKSSIYKTFVYKPSPIYAAIDNNDFDISNLLLDYGADINYILCYNDIIANLNKNKLIPDKVIKYLNEDSFLPINIITYLYKNKLLNFENLTYILNNGFDICEVYDEIVKDFISNNYFDTSKEENKKYSEYSCSFLEIFLKNVKEYEIKSDYYKLALNNSNIITIAILLYYDNNNNNKNEALLQCDSLKESILGQLNNIKSFHECNFYYNINKENGYIDEKIFLNLKSYVNEFYRSFLEKREKIKTKIFDERFGGLNIPEFEKALIKSDMISNYYLKEKYKNNESNVFKIDDFEKFLRDNNIVINELNSTNFDILIYAIDIDSSDELIKYIIGKYETLNYSFSNNIKELLISAINKRKFDIADYLLEKGAKYNYIDTSNILNEIILNKQNIKYLFSNNYSVNTSKDNNEIIKRILNYPKNNNEIKKIIINHSIYGTLGVSEIYDDLNKSVNGNLETYLNYSLIKEKKIKIDDSIYESVLSNHNIEALLLLYEHDYRDKDIVSTIIYNKSNIENTIYYLNKLNNNKAKKLISKLEEIDIFNKKRNGLLPLLINNKSDITKSKSLFKVFIKNNNIDIKEINTYDFDMLIYAIENNFSTEFIKYIIDLFDYKTFDYVVKKMTPLMVCISNKKFEIADLLLEKGANINYKAEYDNEIFGILDKCEVDIQNVKYLLNNGFTDSNYLISKCYREKELIEIIIPYYFYNEYLIKKLLIIYKTKQALSVKELKKILSNFLNEIFNDDIYYKIKKVDVLNTFFDYEFDNRKKNKIFFKLEVKMNNPHRNCCCHNCFDYDLEDL